MCPLSFDPRSPPPAAHFFLSITVEHHCMSASKRGRPPGGSKRRSRSMEGLVAGWECHRTLEVAAVVEGLVDVVFNRNVNARTEELSTAVQGPPGTGRLVASGGPGRRYESAMWVKKLRSSRRARCGAPYPDCHPHAANHEPFAIGRAPGAQDRQKGQDTDKQGRHDCGAQCPLPCRRSVRDGPRRAQFQPGHEPVPRRHALAASAGFAAA